MIRRATLDDLEPLMELVKEFHYATNRKKFALFEESVSSWADWVVRCMEKEDGLCYVAESDGVLVGFLMGVFSHMYWNPSIKIFIQSSLWVSEDHRREGWADKLVDEMLLEAENRGVHTSCCGVTTEYNTKATTKLWLKKGFFMGEKTFFKRMR